MAKKQVQKSKPGPEADRLKLEGDWEENVKTSLAKPKPADGWPKHDEKKPPRKSK